MEITVNFLLKFGCTRDIQRLYKKGEIYMNTVQTFAELEKKEVGDILERTVEIRNFDNGNLYLTNVETGKSLNLELQSGKYKKDYLGDLGNIYCTYSISALLLKRRLLHRVNKKMFTFGNHCLVIHNVPKFIELIENELKRRKLIYTNNLVQYRNFNKNNHFVTYFHKSHLLSYQHEHRFVVLNKTGLPLVFQIGSLKNISEIYNSNDVLNKVTFERY
jgi:hypothetical protein